MPTYRELLQQVRAEISELDAALAREVVDDGTAVIVDVREQDEWDEGHIPGAVHIPRGFLESRVEQLQLSLLADLRNQEVPAVARAARRIEA